MTLTAAGSATTVEVGSSLLLTATTDHSANNGLYTIVWTLDSGDYAELDTPEGVTNLLTGLADGVATVTAEVKKITYVGTDRVLVSLDIPVTDEIEITAYNVFTVTYDLNGGNIGGSEADVVVVDVPYGTLVGSAYDGGTPVLGGSTWTTPYWVTTSGGSTDAAGEAVVADITVYAYWV